MRRYLGQDDGSDTSGDDSFYSAADQAAAQAAADSSDFNSGGADYGSVTGQDSQALGTDFNSLIMAAKSVLAPSVPPTGQVQPPPASAGTQTLPQGASPPPSSGGFFDSSTCGTQFCFQDLLDPQQPYLYIGGALLVGGLLLALTSGRKAA